MCVPSRTRDGQDSSQSPQQQCPSWWQGTRCWNKGSGMARNGQAHFRWPDSQGPYEDQEGSHCQPPQARRWPKGYQEAAQAGLHRQEGQVQPLYQEVQARRLCVC